MTSRWSALPLKDVIGFKKGKRPKVLFDTPIADGLPYLLIENFGKVATGYTNDKSCGIACEQDTLLVCDGARTGLASIGHRGYIGSTLAALSPDISRILPEYLYYFIREKFTLLNSRTRGATIPHLDRELLFGLNLPLPSLNEQRRIVDILSRAEGIVRLRREAQKKAAELIPALFLEMFGDPATNPKGWPVVKLAELLAEPPTLGTMAKPSSNEGRWLDLRVANIQGGQLRLNDKKWLNLPDGQIKRFALRDGDIVLARAIGSLDHLGKAVVVYPGGDWTFDSHLMRVRLDRSRLLPEVFKGFLESSGGREEFLKHTRQSAVQFNINGKELREIQVPLLPLGLQQEYLARVESVRSIQSQQSAASAKAQATFDALLAQMLTQ